MLEVEGVDVRFAAASGISAAVALWSVCAQAVESLMQEHGITPSILKSENFADGPEYNRPHERTLRGNRLLIKRKTIDRRMGCSHAAAFIWKSAADAENFRPSG